MKGLLKRSLKILAAGLLLLCALSFAEVLAFRFFNPPFTTFMAWRWVASRIQSGPDEEPYRIVRIQWRTLRQVSPNLVKAVLAAEDQRFLSHHGFDFIEIQEALREMLSSRRIRGASTISMQVARTVFLWPSRTWLRKIYEAYYTLLLELTWPKKRILEVYLNTVDWGEGVVGAESASRKYFRRSSAELTPSEAAMLAAILPNPHYWSPVKPTEHLRERQRKIMNDMEKMPVSRVLR
ncbi:MAG: monofunctional biosynthetic peptidoglycan transglycosylase [Deltaproteobacteria bacterium HGW-Deltaproteobacteria-21]|nr:MAG: monofunctional biosynthetic peptidoglycan transglycosylase [Deltaproteobacteria bacterium HGW-Deltaproteobacteria-21]